MSLLGTSLVVQYLKCCTSTAGDTGLTSGQGTKIIHAMECEGGKNVIFALEIIHGISFNSVKVQVPSVVSEPHTICTISPGSCTSYLTQVLPTPFVTSSDLNSPGMLISPVFALAVLCPWKFTLLTSLVPSSVSSTVNS